MIGTIRRLTVLQLDALRFVATRESVTVGELAKHQDCYTSDVRHRISALLRESFVRLVDENRPRRYAITNLGHAELEMHAAGRTRCTKCGEVYAATDFPMRSEGIPSAWCRACMRAVDNARNARLRAARIAVAVALLSIVFALALAFELRLDRVVDPVREAVLASVTHDLGVLVDVDHNLQPDVPRFAGCGRFRTTFAHVVSVNKLLPKSKKWLCVLVPLDGKLLVTNCYPMPMGRKLLAKFDSDGREYLTLWLTRGADEDAGTGPVFTVRGDAGESARVFGPLQYEQGHESRIAAYEWFLRDELKYKLNPRNRPAARRILKGVA